jgi:hypothetical protein
MSARSASGNRKSIAISLGMVTPLSLNPWADRGAERRRAKVQFTPMEDLNLMIKNGWGDIPQNKLPADWRTRRNGDPLA